MCRRGESSSRVSQRTAQVFKSSTREIPRTGAVPRHVAIIMDGNGRWAKQRLLPRVAGHRRGVEAVRATVRAAIERGVEFLTLFAFSSENWRRPADEVSILMDLFLRALEQEVAKLHENNIRFKVVGDMSRFPARIRELIAAGEALTARNTRPDADRRRELRRPLGHRAGGAALFRRPSGGGGGPAGRRRTRSTRISR